MKLNILYFGLIAEQIKTTSEELILDTSISINQLQKKLIKKHAILNNLEYQIAYNKQITSKETIINSDSEIALLPPFAGG